MKRNTIIAILTVIFLIAATFRYITSGDEIHVANILHFAFKATVILGLGGVLLGLIVLPFGGREKSVAVTENYSVVVIMCLLLSVVAELGLRFIFQDVTTTGDNASYFSHRWNRHVKYNHLGFRGEEFTDDKPAGVYRIAAVGDSLTFGQGIDAYARFSDRIEHTLNRESKNLRYQVLNFGRPGAETVDELDILNKYVLPAHPDFVLLQWFTNDPEGRNKSSEPRPNRLFPDYLMQSSVLLYLTQKEFAQLQRQLHWIGSYHDYMMKRFIDPNSPDSRAEMDALRAFVALCRMHGISVGMVVFSNSYYSDEPLDFLADRVLAFGTDEKITCVDMRGPLAPYENSTKLWADRLDPHPSALANKLAADAILAAFKREWLIRG
jgi:hypothetical protein